MRKAVAAKLVNEAANWGHAGMIDAPLLKTLQARYDANAVAGRVLLRWLGFLALFLLGSSVFGFIGFLLGPVALSLAPVVLGAFAFASWRFGVKLATDPTQHYATTGAVLVTFGFLLLFAALATAYSASGADSWRIVVPAGMGLTAVGAVATAYRYSLRWPLLLFLLLVFHAVGNKHGFAGGGSYFLGIRDEWLMLTVALATVLLGYVHERFFEAGDDHRHLGFGHVYLVVGLLYANVSLWFLSIPGHVLMPALLFAAAGVAQLVVGARLHDSRFTGFGIVFLAINLYTRLFEGFWDALSKGMFFLAAGLIALIVGALFESRAAKLRSGS